MSTIEKNNSSDMENVYGSFFKKEFAGLKNIETAEEYDEELTPAENCNSEIETEGGIKYHDGFDGETLMESEQMILYTRVYDFLETAYYVKGKNLEFDTFDAYRESVDMEELENKIKLQIVQEDIPKDELISQFEKNMEDVLKSMNDLKKLSNVVDDSEGLLSMVKKTSGLAAGLRGTLNELKSIAEKFDLKLPVFKDDIGNVSNL